jgi:hypothetical protein
MKNPPMRTLAAILFALMTALVASPPNQAQSGGTIRGQVLDPMGAVIAKAAVRILDARTRQTIDTVQSGEDGRFTARNLPAGDYLIAASATGFREKLAPIGTAKAGSDTSVTIHLEVLDCDAPGVNCDIFTTGPYTDPHPIVSRHDLSVRGGEAVNLDQSTVASQPADSDIRLEAQSEGLFLLPANKALIYQECGTEGACGKGRSTLKSVRIDGLGLGSEFCIKTRTGRCSKIYLTKQVDPGADQATMLVVTREK